MCYKGGDSTLFGYFWEDVFLNNMFHLCHCFSDFRNFNVFQTACYYIQRKNIYKLRHGYLSLTNQWNPPKQQKLPYSTVMLVFCCCHWNLKDFLLDHATAYYRKQKTRLSRMKDEQKKEKTSSQWSCKTVSLNSENIYKCSIPKFSKISFSISLSDVWKQNF